MIIALEGMDCTGKTTQSELLVERLTKAGFKAHAMSFPRKETDIGKAIYKRFFDLGIASRSKKVDRYALELLLEADRYEAQQKIGEFLRCIRCWFLIATFSQVLSMRWPPVSIWSGGWGCVAF